MKYVGILLLVIILIQASYFLKSIAKDLCKINRSYKWYRLLYRISKHVIDARTLSEQGNNAECLRKLDIACDLIYQATDDKYHQIGEEHDRRDG